MLDSGGYKLSVGDPVCLWIDGADVVGKVIMLLKDGYVSIQLTNGDIHRVPAEILHLGGFTPCKG